MSDDDSLFASVSVIAARIVELNKLGTDQYRPIVDDLIRSRCRDKQQIERNRPTQRICLGVGKRAKKGR